MIYILFLYNVNDYETINYYSNLIFLLYFNYFYFNLFFFFYFKCLILYFNFSNLDNF